MKKFYLIILNLFGSIKSLPELFPNNRKQTSNLSLKSGVRVVGLIFIFIFLSRVTFSQGFTANGKLVYKDTMLLGERAAPTFADVDDDGDLDLYVGSNDLGKIAIFLNDGNGNFEANGYMEYNTGQTYFGMNPHPAFADIDGDNDLDIFDGYFSNAIIVYEQTSPGVFEEQGFLQVEGSNFSVGYNTTPCFVDLDRDADYDLAVGDSSGVVHICYNNGGVFTLHDTLEADGAYIDVGDNSAPAFGDADGDGDIDIYVGNRDGKVEVFSNNGSNVFTSEGYFTADETVDVGSYAKPTFGNIDNDGVLELYIGCKDTTIYVFSHDGSGNYSANGVFKEIKGEIRFERSGQYSSPEFADVDGDDDLDLYIGNLDGYIGKYTNEGTGIFSWGGYLQDGANLLDAGSRAHPTFADLDGDDDLDLYVGESSGTVLTYTNDGSGGFTAAGAFQSDGSTLKVIQQANPVFADLDGDDDLDLYVGEYLGHIQVYLNDGTGTFTEEAERLQAGGADIDVGEMPSPYFIDIDADSDLDLYVANNDGKIFWYTNDGTGTFSEGDTLKDDGAIITVGGSCNIAFANLDGSCMPNLYAGEDAIGYIYEYESLDITPPSITSEWTEFDAAGNENCEAGLFNYASILAVTDNCDAELDKVQTPASGSTLTYGDNPVKIVVTDDAGYSDSISFNVLVYDNIDPVITSTHDSQVLIASSTSCDATLPDYTGDVTAEDNCDLELDITQSPVAGTLISGSDQVITLIATDNDGNFVEYEFYVTVEDQTDPVITSTHDNQVLIASSTSCDAILPDYTGDVTAEDNCDLELDITQSPVTGTVISGATNSVTITVTDDEGNYNEISFNISVEDNTKPEITCVDDATVTADEDGDFTISGTTYDPTASDNCNVASITNDINSISTLDGESFSVGTHTITWTATDDAGNYKTCSTTLTVQAGATGIYDLMDEGITIFPNPIGNTLNIKLEKPLLVKEIKVFDITGHQLFVVSKIVESKQKIDMSQFESGIYLIQVRTEKTTYAKKIIKK